MPHQPAREERFSFVVVGIHTKNVDRINHFKYHSNVVYHVFVNPSVVCVHLQFLQKSLAEFNVNIVTDDRYAVSNGSVYVVLISLNEYAVLDKKLDTPYPMKVDTPYSTIDQNSVRRSQCSFYGVSRILDTTSFRDFLKRGPPLDIFQKFIFIHYFNAWVLVFLDSAYELCPLWSLTLFDVISNPDNFRGTEGAVELRRWFEKTEMTFGISECVEDKKDKFAAATLRGPALTWWNYKVTILGLDVANQIGWTEMKKLMTAEFCPTEELQRMENEL
ncbi:hypothetical protein Tco_0892536 [Tanacetum coccineum]|uniref:Retrotransposon gag domain-containing protein n=1 Tax=Tanacetum coccineum TaxID=301880 RepID=A0ABQ5CC76_9ASTR